jgi:hypothetical protein
VAGGTASLWFMEVMLDDQDHMYLHKSWWQFAHAHTVEVLVFKYNGYDILTVKVFDEIMCLR